MTAQESRLLCYTAAGGIVVDAERNQVLVLVRPDRHSLEGMPEIRLPKGHIEPGEERADAALREVQEEAGLLGLEIVADLGHQTVEFDWGDIHYVRDESAFLMIWRANSGTCPPEAQFQPVWLSWPEAQSRITFESEREWLKRASEAWQALPT